MANINKIKLSGTTYSIQDENASKTVELTQAQYDALSVKDPNTFYIITDAAGGDLSNYYTKSETSGATEISTALASKQDTLVSGTNIKTINNESILGSGNIEIQGGGKAVSGGTNISITTGETADTINCTLPITTAVDNTSLNFGIGRINSERSYSFGNNNTVGSYRYTSNYSMAVGSNNIADGGEAQFVTGYCNKLLNVNEFGSGRFNNSVSASTTFGDSGNTLFSVGNGTSTSARHNAFEIRQNGDIYCSDGTNDVKLQDTITATAANTTALGGLKLVKLSQSEYDSLSTKDNSTLYVIVN